MTLAAGKRVLDAGCGTGYGSAALAGAASFVAGADIAREGVEFARANYGLPNLAFEQASCEALPHPNGAFDLVVSFEMIEHLANWRGFLAEARRVLAPEGTFLVSTPNRLYYTESRGEAGANPFHVHEFAFEEFREELRGVFPHVSMYLQNHMECIAFQPCSGGSVSAQAEPGEAVPREAHFFVALCSLTALSPSPGFVFVPRMANVLRERERHIGLLGRHVELLEQQIEEVRADRRRLADLFDEQQKAIERSNHWADELNRDLDATRARIVALQQEVAREQKSALDMASGYEEQIAALKGELSKAQSWAQALDKQLGEEQERVAQLEHDMHVIRSSRWMKLGRAAGLAPRI